MFSDKVLFGMGNILWKTIKIDRTTGGVMKGKYARVCIELDLNKPLVPSISIYGRVQHVEYEGLLKICFKCGQYGHRQIECPLLKPPEENVPLQSGNH